MKLAIVCPDCLTILILFKELIRSLERSGGWEIVTIGTRDDYLDEVKALGVRHICIDMDRYVNPIKDVKCMIALYEIFRHDRFDVILNATTKPIIFGSASARLAGNRGIVCAFRGMGRTFQPGLGLKERSLKIFVMASFRLACIVSRKVWFTNRSDMEYFISTGMVDRKKTILTNNAINIDFFSLDAVDGNKVAELKKELGIGGADKVVVMVGRLIWSKGVAEFIEASKILFNKYPHVKFILVGPTENGSPQCIPEEYVKKQEKGSNFKWIGFRGDVRELYAISDIAVLPSYYKEGGYPRALLEPMALGKPVIAADSPDCRGPVEDGKNGYLVPVKDAKALADRIEALISDNNRRTEFGRFSRLKIEKEFDEKLVFEKVIGELCEFTKKGN